MKFRFSSLFGPFIFLSIPCLFVGAGCVDPGGSVTGPEGKLDEPLCEDDSAEQVRPDHWQAASHCREFDGDYDRIFDDYVVRRLDISMSADTYQSTMDDLEDLYGGGGGPPGPPGSEDDPIWVMVNVEYEGDTWEHVGMRYKGNSSLRFGYQSGIRKLPFRLDFDEFEDTESSILDQRFWGFKKMTFANGHSDASFSRDKLAANIFRAAGVPAAQGGFIRVFGDTGDGPEYWGLYVMIEDVSDEFLENSMPAPEGVLYKPDGAGARFRTYDPNSFEAKANEEAEPLSDVPGFIDALNDSAAAPADWRATLESKFDVQGYLRFLAGNQIMQNWDTYGWAPHNFYLYGQPEYGGRLTWIPWDLNESLKDRTYRPNAATSGSVMLDELGPEWPLIRYLLDDPVYRQDYVANLQDIVDNVFVQQPLFDELDQWRALIEDYVVGPEGEQAPYTTLVNPNAFNQALANPVDGLKTHITSRRQTILDVLATQ